MKRIIEIKPTPPDPLNDRIMLVIAFLALVIFGAAAAL